MTVAGLVLAAGQGRRLGRPKALVELGGERLVDRAVRVVRDGGCDPVVVVLGAAVVEVPEADLVAVNENWARGMGSSLTAGLAAMPPEVEAVVITLVDLPGVGAEAVRRLVAAYHDGATVAVATYGGQRRNPVLLAAEHWDDVTRLAVDDIGARAFLDAHPELVVGVPCDDVGDPTDIDTLDDLRAVGSAGPRLEHLPDGEAVITAAAGDFYVRNTIRPAAFSSYGWRRGEAVAWVGLDAEERTPVLSVIGPADQGARLLAEIAEKIPAGVPLTVPVDVADRLPAHLAIHRQYHWRFRTSTVPMTRHADIPVRVMPDAGDERIAALLREVGGTFSAWPGDEAVNRWIVVEDAAGLVACAADTTGAAGIGHMGSVAVHSRARGRGVATGIVSWLTADLLADGNDVVVVGVFVEETAAQRLYDRVGFRTEHEFFTGPVLARH